MKVSDSEIDNQERETDPGAIEIKEIWHAEFKITRKIHSRKYKIENFKNVEIRRRNQMLEGKKYVTKL